MNLEMNYKKETWKIHKYVENKEHDTRQPLDNK